MACCLLAKRGLALSAGARVPPTGLPKFAVVQLPTQRQAVRASAQSSPKDPLNEGCPVPLDQQPQYELQQLQDAFLFDWAKLPLPEFALRLAGVFGLFFMTLGLPISAVTFDANSELPQLLSSAIIGSGFIVMILVLRLYLGYSHVGSRLLSASVEYEETGWYDGQIWIKSPAMLMRDRLLGIYQVKPTLEKLKTSLLGLSGVMALAVVLLVSSPPPKAYSDTIAPYESSAPVRSVATAAVAGVEEYEARVERFEPWGAAADEGGEEVVGRPSLLQHMRQL